MNGSTGFKTDFNSSRWRGSTLDSADEVGGVSDLKAAFSPDLNRLTGIGLEEIPGAGQLERPGRPLKKYAGAFIANGEDG